MATMSIRFLRVLFCIPLLAAASHSRAEIIVDVDVNPAVAGVQNSIDLLVGQTAPVDVYISFTAPTDALFAYNFNTRFTPATLGYVAGSRTEFPLAAGWFQSSSAKTELGNTIAQIDGTTFGAQLSGIVPRTRVATFSFVTLATGAGTITPGNFDGLFNVWLREGAAPNTNLDVSASIVFNPSTINISAVPEPSTLAMLALASGSVGIVRRWRKH
jgi:hypothetical protein